MGHIVLSVSKSVTSFARTVVAHEADFNSDEETYSCVGAFKEVKFRFSSHGQLS